MHSVFPMLRLMEGVFRYAKDRRAWLGPCVAVGLLIQPIQAQTVIPNVVEFLPSPAHHARLDSSGSGRVYLSDLMWVSTTNGRGPVERDQSNGDAASEDGRPMMLNGVIFTKGLGVHAPSDIVFVIPSGCTTLVVDVGVDAEVGANGSVAFQVLADGLNLFETDVIRGSSMHQSLAIDLTGRKRLQLVTSDGGDGPENDHGDWADAQLICPGGLPVVSRYDIAFYAAAAFDPFLIIDIGKPPVQADGLIRVDLSNRISSWPTDVESEARVIAVGPGGLAVGDPSNRFVYPGAFVRASRARSLSEAEDKSMSSAESRSGLEPSELTSSPARTTRAAGAGRADVVAYTGAPNNNRRRVARLSSRD